VAKLDPTGGTPNRLSACGAGGRGAGTLPAFAEGSRFSPIDPEVKLTAAERGPPSCFTRVAVGRETRALLVLVEGRGWGFRIVPSVEDLISAP
jgi:hypothetical protein